MARGGARAGAGRPLGSATKKSREIADRASQEGLTPLDYLLSIMRDDAREEAQRIDCAKAAAPYIHPRLSNVEAKVDADVKAQVTEIRRTVVDSADPDSAGL